MSPLDEKDRETLLIKAEEAAKNAYAPYSRFPVGAALLTEGGEVFTGSNIENASYGMTVCAERVAVFKAVSQGATAFKAIAVTTQAAEALTPCGACLQVLTEFAPPEMEVVSRGAIGGVETCLLSELLSKPFSKHSLNRPGPA